MKTSLLSLLIIVISCSAIVFAGCQQPPAEEMAPAADGLSAADRSLAELEARKAASNARDEKADENEGLSRAEIEEQMEAIGYLGESTRTAERTGVVTYVTDKTYDGLTLYLSAHASVAYLMDMNGNEVYEWRCEFDQAFPDYKHERMIRPQSMEHWRRVFMYPNGDLLAIFENIGLIKVDRDSNLLWAYPGRCHHHMQVMDDGTIYVLSNDLDLEAREGGKKPWTLEPTISIVNPDGTERGRIHMLDYFRNSVYRPLLNDMQTTGDLLHFNTIEIFDGSQVDRASIFKKGNILVSSRKLSFIAILDPEIEKAVWVLRGMWQGQHEPTLLDNGNILLFDNRKSENRSQVMEFNPFTQEVVWLFSGTDEDPLFSGACAMQQRLPNGNTLIAETQGARILEVTPENEVVWQYLNKHPISDAPDAKLANIHAANRLTEWPEWLPKPESAEQAVDAPSE